MPPYPRRSRQGLKRFSPELVRRDLELLLAPGTVAGRVASNHLARTTQITDEDLERLSEVLKPGTTNLISEAIRALRSSTNQPPSGVLHPLVNKHWDKVFEPGLVAGLNSLLARVATPSDVEGAFNRAQFIMQSGREAAQFKMARELFLFAAERKHPGAQMALGRIYSEGIGVEKNDAEAFQWYLQAAKLEAPHAGCRVADLYAAGRAVLQNIEQATEWYEREARLGCSRSQYMCGRRCESARPAEALAGTAKLQPTGLPPLRLLLEIASQRASSFNRTTQKRIYGTVWQPSTATGLLRQQRVDCDKKSTLNNWKAPKAKSAVCKRCRKRAKTSPTDPPGNRVVPARPASPHRGSVGGKLAPVQNGGVDGLRSAGAVVQRQSPVITSGTPSPCHPRSPALINENRQ